MIWWIVAGVVFLVLLRGEAVGATGDWKARATWWARNRDLSPELVWGVIITESGGDPNAKNPSDPSAGLMQVTPIIGRAYAGLSGNVETVLESLLDPEVNIRAGTGFMAHLQAKYGASMPVVEWIQAYNLGETFFDKGKRNLDYARKVLANMALY